jgi:hypothetical protein
MATKDTGLAYVRARILVSRYDMTETWTDLGMDSVTIVSVLRLTSLVKFANTQNITCMEPQCAER